MSSPLAGLLPLVSELGAQGVVALARAYLGPVADEVSQKEQKGAKPEIDASRLAKNSLAFEESAPATSQAHKGQLQGVEQAVRVNALPVELTDQSQETDPPKAPSAPLLSKSDLAVLATALAKLVFEAGELALHNPQVSGQGKLPEFKLDPNGSAPALSLAHAIAATRLLQETWAKSAAASTPSAAASPAMNLGSTAQTRRVEARAQRYSEARTVTSALAGAYRFPR